MNTKLNRFRVVRSVVALLLACAVIFGSVFTVAAAIQTTENTNANQNNSKAIKVFNNNFKFLDVFEVTVNNNGDAQKVIMAKGTVADVLAKAEISLGENQVVVPSEKTDIVPDMQIEVLDAKKIKVTADGETKNVLVPYGNVVESLNKVGYNLSEDDILNVSRDSKVEDISVVKIQRVDYGEETVKEKVDYEVVKQNSDEVELGETKVVVEGVEGEKLVTRKCKYVDGKKVSEEEINSKVIKKPVDEVTYVGTKGAAKSGGAGTFTDENGVEVAYSQVLTGSGTAYTAPAGALTATGVPAYHGGVAVNPNIIPYGSKLYIVSTDGSFVYGYATAVDTGGALMDGSAIVDCFYGSYGECVNFGRRNVNVYVVA